VVRDTQRFREIHRQVSSVAVYPFSSSRRLELTGGVQSITSSSQTKSSEYSAVTGRLVNVTTVMNPDQRAELLGNARAALVYDSATYGPTSPVLGKRYRFALSPTFGGLTFTTMTADYRQYWMPLRPVTLAVRVMHLGRYGADANDPRLLPLAWTLRDLVRGFGDTGPGRAPLGSLGASRMFVANSEVRLPVWGLFSRQSHAGPLPIEALVFSDFGRFWTGAQPNASTALLRSAGVGARINAAGMIFELDAVHRFDVSRGWTFSFNLRPGF
jgi:outer membrane protein assembly factor BamA